MEEEAYRQAAHPEFATPFTDPLFGEIVGAWSDWKNGIPPSEEWSGRGAQNPHLLDAFAALDRAKYRAEAGATEANRVRQHHLSRKKPRAT